jgi:3-hydroxy-9,10-secoandrosta-1,3,5(10)-triene-9,17-dione monooxygenase
LLGWDILSPLIGIVRGTVDQFVSRIRVRLGRGGLDSRAPDSAAMQMRLAESTAELDAARTILMHDVHEILGRAARGERFSPLDRARYLRDRAFSAKLCLQAANRMYEALGGHAVFQSEPIQRLHRDAYVLVHREAMMMDVTGQIFGRLILEENASPPPWQVQGIDG